MPKYGKNPLKSFFSRTENLGTLKLGIKHSELKASKVGSNDVPSLTSLCMHIGKKVKSKFINNYWRVMYHNSHTNFINQEHGNISSQGQQIAFDLCFNVTQILISAEALGAHYNRISFLASWGWGNSSLFKWYWSVDC